MISALSGGKWKMRVTSYRLGNEFTCVVDNVDPGANIARATAPTREEAESRATQTARTMLKRTRVVT